MSLCSVFSAFVIKEMALNSNEPFAYQFKDKHYMADPGYNGHPQKYIHFDAWQPAYIYRCLQYGVVMCFLFTSGFQQKAPNVGNGFN